MRERLWVALDVETLKEADGLLERLVGAGPAETIGAKIGSQLFTAAGPAAVETALKRGFPVFLDLKFHDIPNTVAGAVREATRIGVAMLDVHAGGGGAMMRAAAEAAGKAAKDFGVARPICLGVTVLTSLDRKGLEEVGVVRDRKSTRLNSSHVEISYAVFCLKKKKSHEAVSVHFSHVSKKCIKTTSFCKSPSNL